MAKRRSPEQDAHPAPDEAPGAVGPADAPMTRRERVREATLREIKEIARAHLIQQGTSGVSLRAIAREMGMTAPGLYRYFSSLRDLIASLRADFFGELAAAISAANATLPADDVDGRILASLRCFRSWALAHRAEFALLFGPPAPAQGSPHEDAAVEAAQCFASTFFALFTQLMEQGRFIPPEDTDLPADLCRQLEMFAERTGFDAAGVSDGALRVLTACWVRLYGLVCMEVFEHFALVMDDMQPLFEAELREFLGALGVRYTPPS